MGPVGCFANAATLVEHNGISAWKLNDGTFVRVTVSEEYNRPSLDSFAVAKIQTGRSWVEVADWDKLQASTSEN